MSNIEGEIEDLEETPHFLAFLRKASISRILETIDSPRNVISLEI